MHKVFKENKVCKGECGVLRTTPTQHMIGPWAKSTL